jgi:hypothetical protein
MKNILLILSILIISSCKKENNPIDNGISQETIPTKIGNQWLSSITRYDTSGAILSIGNDTIWISRDTTIQGIKYFTFLEGQFIPESRNGNVSRIHLYDARNTSSGFVKWDSPGEVIIYKYPSQIGESYVYALDTSITVPAGTFKCVCYKAELGEFTTLSFICPGIGFVKSEIYFSSVNSLKSYRQAVVELMTYKTN